MFNWRMKATNAIYLEDTNGNEGRPFKARFLQAGLVRYDFGVCLLKKETIDKFVNTFIGAPVIIDHKDNLTEADRVGTINNIWFSPEDGWFWCDGIITDEKAVELIEKGYNVSCQYRITDYSENTEDKLHNGNEYDKEILDGVFEHLAIVENPRYEDAFIAVNAYIACNEDKWITVHPNGEENKGRHLLIKDGESVEDAMHRNGWYSKRQAKEEKIKKDTSEYTKYLGVKVAKLEDFSPEIIQTINEALLTLPKEDRPHYITSFKELERSGDSYRELSQRMKKSYGLSWNISKIHKTENDEYINTDTGVFFNSKYKNLKSIEKAKKEFNAKNPSEPYYFNTNGQATFFHELGHQYENKHGIDEDFKKIADEWANSTPYRNIKKSEYGRIKEGQGANYKEAFAEAWAGYHTKNPDLPENIRKYFDKLTKSIAKNEFKEEDHPRNKKGEFTNGKSSDSEKFNKEIDKIKSGEYPRGKQVTVIEKPSKVWLQAGLQDKKIVMPVAVFHKATQEKHNVDEETIRKFPELLEDPPYIFKSSTEPNSFVAVLDAVEKEGDIEKPLIVAVKPVNDRVEVNIITSTYGKDNDFIARETQKGNLLYKRKKTASNSVVASLATETLNPSNNIITDNQTNFNPNVTINKAANEISKYKKVFDYLRTMKGESMDNETKGLFDKIAELIARNEEDEETKKDKKDEQASNDDVDKRDIIRQIMAIAGKHEDNEDVRTIAKLAEKLAYDKSEAGTADNKAKNEDDEEDDDDKKVKNKCKNEDDTDYKKLYEELKEKVDKEAENKKAKNSLDALKKLFYEGEEYKPLQGYMTQKQGIELGKQLY